MTVYDREYEVLLSTLRSLVRSIDDDDEVIVVNDGSHMNYDGVKAYGERRLPKFRWIDMPQYEAFRIAGGFNSPSKAFNVGLEAASKPGLVIMSSDVLVNRSAVLQLKKVNLDDRAWVCQVVDLETNSQYCGPARLFPAPWFLACSTQTARECGGWDESYLSGMCYEDNDFIGRLMLKTGKFLGDWSVTVFHQSHEQPAYNMDDPEVVAANQRSREYTRQKWSGIPFGGSHDSCFDVVRKPDRSGDPVYNCKYYGTLLEDAIRLTKSPFVSIVTA